MRAIFLSLVATSLLIHAVFGCCWHHAHEELAGAVEQAANADGHQHDDCCDEHHGQPVHEPCGGNHCRGLCNYLPVQKVQIDELNQQLPLDFVAILPTNCAEQVVSVVRTERFYESVAEPPVRLHLLHQILVI